MQSYIRKILLIFSAVLLLLALFLSFSPSNTLFSKLQGQLALKGFQSSLSLKHYPMLNHRNQSVTWQDYVKEPLFITTGFTRCPHSCPMTMALYQQLAKILPNNTQFALLTVDPDNDTPNVLATYLHSVNPNFIGLQIADKHQLRLAINDLKQSVQHSPTGNNITHSESIYLLHPEIDGLIIYNKPNVADINQDLLRISRI